MTTRVLVIALLLAMLTGCASIPFSTAMKFASWSARDIAQVDPGQVRVRLSVPDGFMIDIPKAKLQLSLTDAAGRKHEARMPLKLLLATHGERPGGWFSADVPVNTSVLALTDDGAKQLRELQQVILAGDPRGFSFNVSTGFSKMPPDAREITFWADLRMGQDEPYIALIDGADIAFERQ